MSEKLYLLFPDRDTALQVASAISGNPDVQQFPTWGELHDRQSYTFPVEVPVLDPETGEPTGEVSIEEQTYEASILIGRYNIDDWGGVLMVEAKDADGNTVLEDVTVTTTVAERTEGVAPVTTSHTYERPKMVQLDGYHLNGWWHGALQADGSEAPLPAALAAFRIFPNTPSRVFG